VADKRLAELRKIGRTAGRPTLLDHAHRPAAQPESTLNKNWAGGEGANLPTLEHFPEKWAPVFRRKCDKSKTWIAFRFN
jgi:hypothetical protein